MSASLVLIPTAFRPQPGTLTFVTAQLPEGYLVSVAELEAEELTTPGVRGVRYREVFEQYRVLRLATLQGFGSYVLAAAAAELYRKARGSKARLSITTNSLTVTFRVQIRAVDPQVRPGPVAGVASSAASVRAAWDLMRVDF